MRILITGANGFLGRQLVEALRQRGEIVKALVLPGENTEWLESRNVTIYTGDVRQSATLAEPMATADAVFHLAAMIGVWRPMKDYFSVNVTGTENVCRAALKAGISRLIHVSSAMAYRMWVGHPVTEDEALQPLQEPYSSTKALGDRLVQRLVDEEGLPAVIVRPGTSFGPGDRLNFGRIADRIRDGKGVIIGSGRNPVPMVFVTDLIQGLLLALDRKQAVGQAYNIGNDQPLTQEELLGAIAEEIGARPPHIHVPFHVLYPVASAAEVLSRLSRYRLRPIATRHSIVLYGLANRISIDKARRQLDYVPQVSIREGVRLAAAWYRHQASGLHDQLTWAQQAGRAD